MSDDGKYWNPHTVKKGQTLALELGSLKVWVCRGEQDWHVAHKYADGENRCTAGISTQNPDADLDWTRWILDQEIDEVCFLPRMPDRPLIVRPELPVCLMPKQSVEFFIGIPVWISIQLGSQRAETAEIPSLKLSNSWFGPPTEGELCYAVKTTAKLRHEDLLPSASRAVFPLEIKNSSSQKLNFERLCVRPQFLNIFKGHKRLWTSRGRVSYRGEDNWSRIAYASGAPDIDGAGPMIGKAREPLKHGALLKTFDSLKQKVEI